MEQNELVELCLGAVKTAYDAVKMIGNAGISKVAVPGKDELVTKADLAVCESWKKLFRQYPIRVLTEESRNQPFSADFSYTCLGIGDEIDGTYNFNRARGILPNCAIFTIFDSPEPKFKDVLVTAVIEYNSGNLWHAIRGQGCYFNSQQVKTSGTKAVGKDTSIMIDRGPCPSPEHSLRFFNLEQKCWPRNIGCAGVHLAGVASGSRSGWDGFLCMIQKPEELASGCLLVKEASGVLIDISGNDMDCQVFDWGRKYEIIAAATPELAEAIRKELLTPEQAKLMYAKLGD